MTNNTRDILMEFCKSLRQCDFDELYQMEFDVVVDRFLSDTSTITNVPNGFHDITQVKPMNRQLCEVYIQTDDELYTDYIYNSETQYDVPLFESVYGDLTIYDDAGIYWKVQQ